MLTTMGKICSRLRFICLVLMMLPLPMNLLHWSKVNFFLNFSACQMPTNDWLVMSHFRFYLFMCLQVPKGGVTEMSGSDRLEALRRWQLIKFFNLN